MILDVGCGDNPQGDVNCDRYLVTPESHSQTVLTKCKLDVLCDGCFLPFRDRSFGTVVSNHAIEHSSKPFKFLSELVRVCSGTVRVACPHRLAKLAKMPFHRSFLDVKWFVKALEKIGQKKYNITVLNESWFRWRYVYLPIDRPREVQVVVHVE